MDEVALLHALLHPADHGDIGHLAAGPAGRRDDDQAVDFPERFHVIIEIVHSFALFRDGHHLGDVDNRAAAHGDDPVVFESLQILKNRIHHLVRGFSPAVRLLKEHTAGQIQ